MPAARMVLPARHSVPARRMLGAAPGGLTRRVLASALGLALLLLTAGWSPSALAASTTTFTGVSGTYVDWVATRPFRMPLFPSRSLGSASKGDFFGIAMVSDELFDNPPWLTLMQARRTPCVFAGPCTREERPRLDLGSVNTIDSDAMAVFPARRYRVALLGAPGALVTVQLPVISARSLVKTSRRGRLAVTPVATTFPRTDLQQPATQGSVLLKHAGTTIAVMAIRFETAQAVSSRYDYCVSGVPATQPWLAFCNGGTSGSRAGGSGIDYETCPAGSSPCAPVDVGSHSDTVFLGDVRNDQTFFGFDTQTVAANSRVTATVLTLRWS